MSTVFYGYRVEKQNLWEVLDRIREYYKRVHFIYRIRVDPKEKNLEDENTRSEFLSSLQIMFDRSDFKNQVEVDLQLFDFDDNYIFRVLEAGYQFMNDGYSDIVKDDRTLLEPIFYDDRSDMSEKDELNKYLIDEIDHLITNRYYLLAPIVKCDYDIYRYYFELSHTPEGRELLYSTNVPLNEQKE